MEYVLGVHLAVAPNIAREILTLRKKGMFVTGSLTTYPLHVTLYLCRFSPAAYEQLISDLRVQRPRRVRLTISRVAVTPEKNRQRFVMLRVRRTQKLLALHRQVIKRANHLRAGQLRQKDIDRIRAGQYSRQERENTVLFGDRGAGAGFAPHITLLHGTYQAAMLRRLLPALRPIQARSWIAKAIVIGLYRYNNGAARYVGRPREYRLPLC